MDGLTTMKKMRAHYLDKKSRAPYFVALTAHVLETERKRYLDSGFDDHHPKPILKDAFLSQILRMKQKIFLLN